MDGQPGIADYRDVAFVISTLDDFYQMLFKVAVHDERLHKDWSTPRLTLSRNKNDSIQSARAAIMHRIMQNANALASTSVRI